MKLIILLEFLVIGAKSNTSNNLTHLRGKRDAVSGFFDLLSDDTATPKLYPSFCGSRPGFVESKIVGGETARPGEIPWQAAVVKKGQSSGRSRYSSFYQNLFLPLGTLIIS